MSHGLHCGSALCWNLCVACAALCSWGIATGSHGVCVLTEEKSVLSLDVWLCKPAVTRRNACLWFLPLTADKLLCEKNGNLNRTEAVTQAVDTSRTQGGKKTEIRAHAVDLLNIHDGIKYHQAGDSSFFKRFQKVAYSLNITKSPCWWTMVLPWYCRLPHCLVFHYLSYFFFFFFLSLYLH